MEGADQDYIVVSWYQMKYRLKVCRACFELFVAGMD